MKSRSVRHVKLHQRVPATERAQQCAEGPASMVFSIFLYDIGAFGAWTAFEHRVARGATQQSAILFSARESPGTNDILKA